jgi:chromate reductase, NAD(P)H dehydrogenase (quinone)
MKKILAFSWSNNIESIHRQLLSYIQQNYNNEDISIEVKDIRGFETPYFSLEREQEENPEALDRFLELIPHYDGYVFATPEYNGWMPAIFKNLLDWVSRKSKNLFEEKPLLSLSASPGPWAWLNNRVYMTKVLGYFGAKSVAEYSIPSFYENMKDWELEESHKIELSKAMDSFMKSL